MQKGNKIRWRENDEKELKRLIKNFNTKISYVKKKHPELASSMPGKLSFKELKNKISTRSELKRTENSLKRFSRKGAEKQIVSSRGAKSTVWEVNEFKIKQRIENARRTRERKKIESQEVKSRGKGVGVTRSEMGSIKENSLKPSKKNFNNLSQKEWELAKRNIDNMLNENYRNDKKMQMKENYIKGLENAGYSDELIQLIKKVDIDVFINTVETDQEATFDFIYDPIELQVKSDSLYEVWSNVIDE